MLKKLQKIKTRNFIFTLLVFFIFPFYPHTFLQEGVGVYFVFAQTESTGSIVITEIMYDLPGSDTGREWIEVKNNNSADVDLSTYKFFEDDTNHKLESFQGEPILDSGSFAIIADDPSKFLIDWPNFSGAIFDSSFSLSNTGEALTLKDENSNIVDEVNYVSLWGASGNGKSLQRKIDSSFIEELPTPGAELAEEIIPEEVITEEIIPEEVIPEEIITEEIISEEVVTEEVIPEEIITEDSLENNEITENIEVILENLTGEEFIEDTESESTESNENAEENVDQSEEQTKEDPENPEEAEIISTETPKVFINEINWMGSAGNAYGEWIELYCNCASDMDLADFGIYDGDEKLIIKLTKKISAHGYYLIARTTPSHKNELEEYADEIGQFGGSGLSNEAEMLVLKDGGGNIVESLDFRSGWPAGDNSTKETMQWDGAGENWFTSPATPRAENKKIITENSTTNSNASNTDFSASESANVAPIVNVQEKKQEKKIITSKDLKIYFNQNDFSIKFKNTTKKEINLSNLKLQSGSKTFTIPKNTFLLGGSEIIGSSKITGFNQKDDLILIGEDNKIITDASFMNPRL